MEVTQNAEAGETVIPSAVFHRQGAVFRQNTLKWSLHSSGLWPRMHWYIGTYAPKTALKTREIVPETSATTY